MSLDCGLITSGVGVFVEGKLVSLGNYTIPTPPKNVRPNILERVNDMAVLIISKIAAGLVVDHLVVEWQQVYTEKKRGGRKDPKDLLPLTGIAGAVAMEVRRINPACKLEAVLPSTWKGQLPKKLPGGLNPVKDRCWKRLKPDERAAIEDPGSLTSDGWDACGIGLWKLKRFGRHSGRVFAGATV